MNERIPIFETQRAMNQTVLEPSPSRSQEEVRLPDECSKEKEDLKNLGPRELEAFVASYGKERYRTTQILRWLYQKGVSSFDEMTNLSRTFREQLSREAALSDLKLLTTRGAPDGTKKFLFGLEDGNRIESVLIPEKDRLTLCVSTQVGCPLGCRFCLTGKKGWKRDLRSSEIINQILAVRRLLSPNKTITNIVLMGMGEPLLNVVNTMRAVELMVHPDAFRFSSRRVTLSTAGVLPALEALSKRKIPFRLAISLNAADDETRSRLMPINRRYPMERLLAFCRNLRLPPRTRITFEYVLLEGVNDSPADAKRLLKLLRGIPSKVNLIPLNEAPGIPFKRPSDERIETFQNVLIEGGLTAIVRASKGSEISAACGQLQGEEEG